MIHDATAGALAVRWLLYLSLMAVAGLAWFAAWVARQCDSASADAGDAAALLRWPGLRRGLRAAALAGAGVSLVHGVQLVTAMAGTAWTGLDLETLRWTLLQTPFGLAWLARTAALLAVLPVLAGPGRAARPLSWRRLRIVALLGAAALATLPWNGHAGAGQGWAGGLQLLADVAHLWAAAAWLGALAGLLWMLAVARPGQRWQALQTACVRFRAPGTVIVATLLATGLLRTHDLVGWTRVAWTQSAYAAWLVAKVLLFAGMLGLAWRNGRRLVPAAFGGGAAPAAGRARSWRRLRRSVALEAALLLLILALVALLGISVPPSHGGGG